MHWLAVVHSSPSKQPDTLSFLEGMHGKHGKHGKHVCVCACPVSFPPQVPEVQMKKVALAENGRFVKLDMDEMVLRRYLNERLFISSGD